MGTQLAMGEELSPRGVPAQEELENGDAELESSALAERLRSLSWPVPEPGRAEESWERFQRRIAEQRNGHGDGNGGQPA